MNNSDKSVDATMQETEIVTEEGYVLKPRPRPSEDVTLRIPLDALASIDRIAAARDMSREALMKFYIGQGLRQDLAKQYGERVLEKTAQVLTKHLQSEEEVSAILREIRLETAA
jgi:hypothetical protein